MKHRILVVEDEPNMIRGIRDNLEFEGYDVTTAETGVAGLEQILKQTFDLVLLDVMLPGLSGFDICRKARESGNDVPIIFLTAKSEEIDKVVGLELGSDDYITKPFSVRELLARIKAVLRRKGNGGKEGPDDYIQIGRLSVNFTTYSSMDRGGQVKMSHKEFAVLKYLVDHRNTVISRNDLLEKVWGYDETPTTRTVDNFIVKLRHKIEKDPNDPKIILTVHGTGYTMVLG